MSEAAFRKSSVKIAPATKKNLYSITVLTRRFFPYLSLSMSDIEKRLASRRVKYFVALFEGRTIGFVDVEFKKDSSKILGLAVLDEFRNRGVGTALLGRALGEARRHARAVHLMVAEDNTNAMRLYESLGFERIGKLRRKLWGKNILLFRKKLAAVKKPSNTSVLGRTNKTIGRSPTAKKKK